MQIYSKHEGVQYVYPVILKYFFSLDNIPNLLNSHWTDINGAR